MRFTAALFDLDGTLVDTGRLIVKSFQHTFRTALSRDISEQEVYRHFGETLEETFKQYAPDRVAELLQVYRAFNHANHDRLVTSFEGMEEAVRTLHQQGVKLAVVTSKLSRTARRGLEVSGLLPYFDTVVGVEMTTRHKPDPAPLLLALELLGETAGQHVLMVGDTTADVRSGRNAGVQTAVVGWSHVERTELEAAAPDHWLDHPRDLVRLVLQ